MKALWAVGPVKAIRFLWELMSCCMVEHCVFPQIRVGLLRLFGARIGRNAIIYPVRFINLYRGSFKNLTLGDDCFIGHECLIDLAGEITLGDQVTLAQRVSLMTHMNVGYPDHPLQTEFPAHVRAVRIGTGSFVGTGSTVLAGATVGRCCFVAAGAVVNDEFPDGVLLGGVPARILRKLPSESIETGQETIHE